MSQRLTFRPTVPSVMMRFTSDEKWYEPGRHMFVVGKSGSGKTQFMFNVVYGWLQRGHTVVYFTDWRREVYNFLRLRDVSVVVHTPCAITIDPKRASLSEEEAKRAKVVLHPPMEPWRTESIVRKIERRALNIVDIAITTRETKEIVNCVQAFFDALERRFVRNLLVVIDEAHWLFPTQFSTLYTGHMKDANAVNSQLDKMRSYGVSVLLSAQTIKKLNIDATKNINLYAIFKCDFETLYDIWRNVMPVVADLDVVNHNFPDPRSKGEAMCTLYDSDTGNYDKAVVAPRSLFTRRTKGGDRPGTDPVEVVVRDEEAVLPAEAQLDLLLYLAVSRLRDSGIASLTLLREAKEAGLDVGKATMYKHLERGKEIYEKYSKKNNNIVYNVSEQDIGEENEPSAPLQQEEAEGDETKLQTDKEE